MSLDFNVHVSLSADPLALNIEGFRGSLKKVEQHISSVKKVRLTIKIPVLLLHESIFLSGDCR